MARRRRSAPIRRCAPSISGSPAKSTIMASALQLRGVSAGYRETVVLEDINLALAAGERISIIGRNGVGKTTLLTTVLGQPRLHNREGLIGGENLNRVA